MMNRVEIRRLSFFLLSCSQSFSFGSRFVNLFRPSSTKHLADLLEAYDVIQHPNSAVKDCCSVFNSAAWRKAFGSIAADVEVTSHGVVQGKGLIARRDFQVGEVVSMYPIHALGYLNGKSPPKIHSRSSRIYSSGENIIGSSDLVYFEDEVDIFGGMKDENDEKTRDEFMFTMTDPSGKYVYDVNPERLERRKEKSLGHSSPTAKTFDSSISDGLFVAHYVNDASFADFSPVVKAAKTLRGLNSGSDNSAKESKELEDAAVQLAIDYLTSSSGTGTSTLETGMININGEGMKSRNNGFNVVMCSFGPPPLMAYVTTRPVARGEEFLATYELGYWLGKAFPDEEDAVVDAALIALNARPEVQQAQDKADDAVDEALTAADRMVRSEYAMHTQLIENVFSELRHKKRQKRRWRQR